MKRIWLIWVWMGITPLLALDVEKKDPVAESELNLRLSQSAMDAATAMEEYAAKTVGSDAARLKSCAKLARDESEYWLKSSEAYAKKQLSLGKSYASKAIKYGEDRNKDSEKLRAILTQIDANDPERVRRQAEFEKAKAERLKATEN